MNDGLPSSASPIRRYAVVFVVLLGLLALTIWTSRLSLGAWNAPVAIAIAVAKAVLVVLYFMQARYSGRLIGLVIAAACLWLALLVGLTLNDFVTRSWISG